MSDLECPTLIPALWLDVAQLLESPLIFLLVCAVIKVRPGVREQHVAVVLDLNKIFHNYT